MAESWKGLPDDCWELIFNKLHPSHLESLSLSCKRFLSIANACRTYLTVVDQTPTSVLFNRFPNLNYIVLRLSTGLDLNPIITDIAASPNLNLNTLDFSGADRLPLESLKNLGSSRMKDLRVLNCSLISTLLDIDLVVIADSMPCLEDLDISFANQCYDSNLGEVGVTDNGIEVLSSKLKGLRKINISGNWCLTDNSLIALSTNCVYLTEIVVACCSLVTLGGIEFLLRNSTNLTSLSVDEIDFGRLEDSSIRCARNLLRLEICHCVAPDESLLLLSKAGVPLRSYSLSNFTEHSLFTFSGISSLLNKYRSLESLHLHRIGFLTDEKMSDLVQCLSALVTIGLDHCINLTESTFFNLANSCPLLEDICMRETNVGGGGADMAIDFVENPRIRYLDLENNPNLSDECLSKVASACPGLEVVVVSSCKDITKKGISGFFRSGSKIRKMEINGCGGIESIGNGFELSEFEFLAAARTGINDDGLMVIGNRCSRLLHLNLDGCMGVTPMGLNEVLTNCKRLRQLNLTGCCNVNTETVDWMVFLRPSLRRIIVPNSALPSQSQRKLFLLRGCLVFSGVDHKFYYPYL